MTKTRCPRRPRATSCPSPSRAWLNINRWVCRSTPSKISHPQRGHDQWAAHRPLCRQVCLQWRHPELHGDKQVLCDLQMGASLGNPPDCYGPRRVNLQLQGPQPKAGLSSSWHLILLHWRPPSLEDLHRPPPCTSSLSRSATAPSRGPRQERVSLACTMPNPLLSLPEHDRQCRDGASRLLISSEHRHVAWQALLGHRLGRRAHTAFELTPQ